MVRDTNISSQKGSGKSGDDTSSTQEGTVQLGVTHTGKLIVIPTHPQREHDERIFADTELLQSINTSLKILIKHMEYMTDEKIEESDV